MADEEESDSVLSTSTRRRKVTEGDGTGKAAARPGPLGRCGTAGWLEELQQQINAERAERAQSPRWRSRSHASAIRRWCLPRRPSVRGVSAYELYNENQIKATQDKMEALAAQAEQAMQDGDFKRAQTINLQIGRLGGSLAVLERDQAVLAQQREQQPQQQRQRSSRSRSSNTASQRFPPIRWSGRWLAAPRPRKQFLRKHPDAGARRRHPQTQRH